MDKLSTRWGIAFSLLILAIHEGHELAHTVTGRLLCDEWAVRDFNSWLLSHCPSWLPAAAGPLFSYVLIWLGVALTRHNRWAGLALLFAANPFARIFTAAMGGGDEMGIARTLAGAPARTPALHAATLAVVTLICGAAIIMGWRAMSGIEKRVPTFVLLLLWPMILTGTLLFVAFNGLLRRGFLKEPVIAGAPLFVHIVTALSVILLACTWRWLSNRRA